MNLIGRCLSAAAVVLTSPTSTAWMIGRATLFLVLYVGASQFSGLSPVPTMETSLVWPAAGLATFWIATATRRSLPWDLGALTLGSVLASLTTDGDLLHAAAHVLSALAMTLLFRLGLRRWSAVTADPLGSSATRSLRTFSVLAVAALAAALVEAGISLLALDLPAGTASWSVLGQRWLRGWAVIFVFNSTGYLLIAALGSRLAKLRGSHERRVAAAGGRRRGYGPWYEAVGVLTLTMATLYLTLVAYPDLPLMFLIFVPAAWVGARFSPLPAAGYAAAIGLVTIAFTLGDLGPFARVDQPALAAFLAQSFFGVLFCATLALSLLSTRLRRAEREAHSQVELRDRLLATSTAGVLHLQGERVVILNAAARRLLDISPDAARVDDLALERLTHPDGSPLLPSDLPHARGLAGESVVEQELRIVAAHDGGERFLRVTAHRMGSSPQGREVLLTVTDMTEEHAHTRALSAFAGEVAHDLKNPLTVIEGWAEMLESEIGEEGQFDARQALPMVRRIDGAATTMRTLINELLSYTIARDHALRLVPIGLDSLVGEVIAPYRSGRSGARGPQVAPLIDVDASHMVLADVVLVRQLLDNLVANAVKYVAPDTVPQVCITSTAQGDRVRIDVRDNGLGIPPESRKRIFESFYRIDRPGYSGTGLGLSICARVVERHGGHLTVSDGPNGAGSTFSFTLAAHVPRR